MAQSRFWNFQDDDLTFRLDQWRLGIIDAGLYRGFDPVLSGTMNMQLNHVTTGYRKTEKDGTLTPELGIVITKQGVVINEDAGVSIDFAPTTSQPRIDYVVVEHDYIDVQGGTEAVYRVIQGPDGGALPTLDKPNLQVIIGTLTLPAGVTSLLAPGVVYSRTQSPEYGGSQGRYVDRFNGIIDTDLDANGNTVKNIKTPVQDGDAATKKYVDDREQAVIDSIQRATTTIVGITELATANETIAGTDDTRAITPAGLSARIATTSNAGIVELATVAETIAGISANLSITPAALVSFLNNGNYVQDGNYVHTDNNFTQLLLDKLNGIQDQAEVNVQADWNIDNATSDAFIRNKPTVPNQLFLDGQVLRMRRNGVNISSVTLPVIDPDFVNAFSGRVYLGDVGNVGSTGNRVLTESYRTTSVNRTLVADNRHLYRIVFSSFGSSRFMMNINFEPVSTSDNNQAFFAATLQWSIKRRGTNFVEIMVREDVNVVQNVYMVFSGRRRN